MISLSCPPVPLSSRAPQPRPHRGRSGAQLGAPGRVLPCGAEPLSGDVPGAALRSGRGAGSAGKGRKKISR